MFRRFPFKPEMFTIRTAGSSTTGSRPAPIRLRTGLVQRARERFRERFTAERMVESLELLLLDLARA